MKKSISYWAFTGGIEGTKDIRSAMIEAKAAGYEGIELIMFNKGSISLDTPEEKLYEIAKISKEIGIAIPSLATSLFWEYNFSHNDDVKAEKAKDIVKKMLKAANILEADTILVIPGCVDVFFNPSVPVVSYDIVYNKILKTLKELAPFAEKYKVNIGIENVGNKFLLSPLEMKQLVDEIGSPYVGVYFDVGNCLGLQGYPEQWIRILGKRIKKLHFKDYKLSVGNMEGFVDLLEGDVNWPEVMQALDEIGYKSFATIEIVPYRYGAEVRINTNSIAMDKIIAMVKDKR
jgi:L-ribulose-5-phosphate 3-epimerase